MGSDELLIGRDLETVPLNNDYRQKLEENYVTLETGSKWLKGRLKAV